MNQNRSWNRNQIKYQNRNRLQIFRFRNTASDKLQAAACHFWNEFCSKPINAVINWKQESHSAVFKRVGEFKSLSLAAGSEPITVLM